MPQFLRGVGFIFFGTGGLIFLGQGVFFLKVISVFGDIFEDASVKLYFLELKTLPEINKDKKIGGVFIFFL